MKNCDIIIPVYNAFDYLKRCIESVIIYTNLENNRLIIIDDKSQDDRIIPYIENYISCKKANAIFIKNKINLGFIKTVNIGMKFSDNDVLLLNSDTEVTANWLDKLQKCAYSKERIATVTPLSNNATIASVPIYNQANEIPDGYKLLEYQELIDKISYREYGEIPTGVGFCFYIKREALKTVGFFDEESYGKGYGEEEDFCYRCLSYGYRHILCDDVIVFHKSSQSITGNYQEICEIRQKTLQEKHPFYKSNTVRWVSDSPLEYINKNINFNLCINNNKSNVLIILHFWDIQNKYLGGTSLHVLDIIRNLKNKYNFYVLAHKNGNYCLSNYWINGEETIEIVSNIPQFYTNRLFNSDYSRFFKNLIESFNIDIIHIHHMIGHFFDIIDIAKIYKVKLFISLHDYYSVCPRINKINNNVYCGFPNKDECNICLSLYNESIYNDNYSDRETKNIVTWENAWNLLFFYADKIIVPSESAKNEILNKYKHLSIDVIEHGTGIDHRKDEINIDNDKEFHIAFLGNINVTKGKEIIEKLIVYAHKFNDNIYFHLFGDIVSNIIEIKYKRFNHHGGYYREELSELFRENRIKLICIFSIWPETYSYTLTESIANNIPVLAIDIGAVGQRVKENNLGWLIKYGANISEIYQNINNIYNDKNGYRNVIKSISNYKIKNLEEMCNEYDKIYSSYKIYRDKNIHMEKLKVFIKENYLISKNIASSNTNIYKEKEMIYNFYYLHTGKANILFQKRINNLIKCYLENGIKYTLKLYINKILKNIYIRYKVIYKFSLKKNIQIYDIEIKKLLSGKIIVKCGNIDPQICFQINRKLNKNYRKVYIKIEYKNTIAGNLKIYYDYGDGFNENNCTESVYIEKTSKLIFVISEIKSWKHNLLLTAVRIDPPENTKFTIKNIKILEER
jgi:GT2 family glycosyltransferase